MLKALSFAVALAALVLPGASAGAGGKDIRADCARVGDDDRPQPLPPGLESAAIRLFGLASMDARQVERSTVYRCMGGAAWLCNFGANLSCAKADLARVSNGADAYCKASPGSPVVPMAATGHETVNTWECVGRRPRVKTSKPVDARGFIADQWRRLD